MEKNGEKSKIRPAQHQQRQPGLEWKMKPHPQFYNPSLFSERRLLNKVAVITGGDSGIGRAVAVSFAKHGAKVAIVFLDEKEDALETKEFIEKNTDQPCLMIQCDIQKEENCIDTIKQVIKEFDRIDILVNNAGVHYPQDKIEDITAEQLEKTFRTNIFSMFYLSKAVLPHMKKGSTIINTASVTAYRGSHHLMDYASTKGAVVSFTRSLSSSLADKGIRVNGVAPGPVWTPLIPSSLKAEDVAKFGSHVPFKRPAEPSEIAPCFLFLACDDSSYMTGQFLHPNGGEIINT
jgi:NAD(P)-dependent dehydrogenase (short-subunit alcohol dehydrogenase family)